MVTRQGVVKKKFASCSPTSARTGLIAIAIREGDELISVIRTHGDDSIIIGTRDGMAISFHEKDVRPMGRVAVGVRGIKLREGDSVVMPASSTGMNMCWLFPKTAMASAPRERISNRPGRHRRPDAAHHRKTGGPCAA